MDFVVVDVETANADRASICQIGIADFRDGCLSSSWESLVNPQDYFDSLNVSIHGIDENRVRLSPTWVEVYPQAEAIIRGRIVVSHTMFDYVAMQRACERANIPKYECKWLDSTRVVRRTWSAFSHSGYGLANLATEFGINYRAHDALEDAQCGGEILLRAISESGLTIDQWLIRANQPIHPFSSFRLGLEPDPNGPLFGEVLVFTGALSDSRGEAAELASSIGCRVDSGVTKHTTLLVVGDQDIRKLAGHEKSAKQRKAEDLIRKGRQVQILSESDFRQLVINANGRIATPH
ncbi:MAG: exonuclease domain-containing protein [Silvibacterium sp.]